MTQDSLFTYPEPSFRVMKKPAEFYEHDLPDVALHVAWPDGFHAVLPGLGQDVLDDETFRPQLIRIVSEERARWEEAHGPRHDA